MTINTTICVKYKAVDGWHVFESDELPGLYVASQQAELAYNDVGPSIEALVALDEHIKCKAVPEMNFKEFLQLLKHEHDDDLDAPLVLSDKRYLLTGVAA